jgi:ABC-type lipoprotein export system ATPase subunit
LSGTEAPGGGVLVRTRSLGHVYRTGRSEVVALQGLDLELGAGQTLAVVGPSGSGKTTLLNILAGAAKPSHGKVEVAGQDLTALEGRELERYRRQVVGYLWQQSEAGLWPGLTALENVQVPMLAVRGSRRQRRDRAAALLDLLGLHGYSGRLPKKLDYGERQRLALAVAMANQPRLLLCDEPTAELDGPTAQALLSDLADLLRSLGVGAVVVTHDPQLERFVDRVLQIRGSSTSHVPEQAQTPVGAPSLRLLRREAGGA